MPPNRVHKLFHSNVNLPRSFTQYDFVQSKIGKSASMEGLNRTYTTMSGNKKKKRAIAGSREKLPLCLPRLEPDVDLELDAETRDASATLRLTSRLDQSGHRTAQEEEVEIRSDSEESDYLNNYEDDTATARKRLDKIGEFEMEHNWLLHDGFEKEKEDFNNFSRKLTIPLPDENPVTTVETRLSEIRSMVKPKAELGNFIEKLNPEQREKIMRIAEMDVGTIRKNKRKNWKKQDILNHALTMTILMNRACIPRRKYFKEDKPEIAINLKKLKQQEESGKDDPPLRSSIDFDMELALCTEPEFRTEKDLKKVIWVLRATKAFNHLFPVEKERELAQVVAYERYDANRIMANQGRRPEKFYYILTGKVQRIREYTLYSGKVSRSEGMIHKGTTTDLDELEEQRLREHHLVTKGQVEVLSIHRDDLMRLQSKTQGPPIEYLRTLALFFEFPVEVFVSNPDAIELKYYGQDVVISDDTNRTPWLHVVKSGRVRVVRIQKVIDVQNESKFATQKMEDLGLGRSFSHADAMLGSLFAQRKAKAMRSNPISLTEMPDALQQAILSQEIDLTTRSSKNKIKSQFAEGVGILSNLTKRHKSIHQEVTSSDKSKENKQPEPPEQVVQPQPVQQTQPDGPTKPKNSRRKAKLMKAPIIVEPGNDNPKSRHGSRADYHDDHCIEEVEETSSEKDDQKSTSGGVTLPPINLSNSATTRIERNGSTASEFQPHGTFLTREKTEAESAHPRRRNPKKHEQKYRRAKLQLDILTQGDIFGLDAVARKFSSLNRDPTVQKYIYPEPYISDRRLIIDGDSSLIKGLEHMDPPIASEPKGVSLISDGAEVIRISKRFFLQHAQNNTMLRVETMQREYMATDEASTILYNKETWNQYKDVLLKRMVDMLSHRSAN